MTFQEWVDSERKSLAAKSILKASRFDEASSYMEYAWNACLAEAVRVATDHERFDDVQMSDAYCAGGREVAKRIITALRTLQVKENS